MQSGIVLVTLLIGIRHLLPGDGSRGGAFDAFCPFGGIETMWAYLTTGHTLKTTNLLNFSVLLAVLGVSLLAGRAFCGWICPLGTLQDMFSGWARRLSGENNKPIGKKSKARFPIKVPARLDNWLRYLKYIVLAVIIFASSTALYPPIHDLCPARAFFSFNWNTPLLGLVLVGFALSSMLIQRFSCKYVCPLGAALAIFNKISPIQLKANPQHCTTCGRCDNECPMDIIDVPQNLRSTECIRCLECMETCARPDAIELRLG